MGEKGIGGIRNEGLFLSLPLSLFLSRSHTHTQGNAAFFLLICTGAANLLHFNFSALAQKL